MKILFLSAEVAPFTKTGGLGDVANALPATLAAHGHEVMVVTPRYATVPSMALEPLKASLRLRFPFGDERAELWSTVLSPGHEVVFLDHPGFFGRPGMYGEAHGDYGDNHRRFAFFSVGALTAAQVLNFQPDIIHLNDWQTGLAAAALRRGFAHTPLARAKVVFTIHNLAYQGLFPKWTLEDLELPWDLFHAQGLEMFDGVSFLKAGLAFSDALTTVSPTYALEIQTPEYGFQLDGFLRARSDRLTGILNGVDYGEWNPAKDSHLPARYSAKDLSPKEACKRALRERMGLSPGGDPPIFGLVARLTAQKGIDLLLQTLPFALERGCQVVMLGSGERRYEDALHHFAYHLRGRLGVHVGFDTGLAHLIEAGSDFFLMPSRYEPCGLNQMYSLRYGTPPVVRATGGLEDSVVDAQEAGGDGFKFHRFDPGALLWAFDRAREYYRTPERLMALRKSGMAKDYSWEASAGRYEEVYAQLLGQREPAARRARG